MTEFFLLLHLFSNPLMVVQVCFIFMHTCWILIHSKKIEQHLYYFGGWNCNSWGFLLVFHTLVSHNLLIWDVFKFNWVYDTHTNPWIIFYVYNDSIGSSQVSGASGHNGHKPKRPKPKRPQTETATNRNGHRPEGPQTETATNRNGHKPERPQTRTATNRNGHK